MTVFIIIFTSLISIMAFSNSQLVNKYQFNAYSIFHEKEWYRLFTHALFHGSWMHLLINMLVLYSFGEFLIFAFRQFFTFIKPGLLFLIFYILATGIASLYSLRKHRNNRYYNALGASGAVSAVVFASIFFEPYQRILFFGILPIPGIIFGGIYLWYSYYMSKKGTDNIGHDAHFYGAVFGFIFPLLIDPQLLLYFLERLMHPHF
ncbi:MAG: rhomboid family intramembrane serine protease [Salinivirgaceae bacterium]|nr:rhomboid family intramembrane serine protease [Salinivirgaceae bacterium]MDD4747788.1 rhomboid family intramembrane serine protease [Salinivirgaceae bacterium]MDY0280547.1 rhomboid family intramembrane serine protease [Salinivirgaceae bacterium]